MPTATKSKPETTSDSPSSTVGSAPEPDERATLVDPPSAVRAREKAQEEADGVRENQAEARLRSLTDARVKRVETVVADATDEDSDPETLVVAALDGKLVLYASAPELRFGRGNIHALNRAISRVGQDL